MDVSSAYESAHRIAAWGVRHKLVSAKSKIDCADYVFERLMSGCPMPVPRFLCIDFVRHICGRNSPIPHTDIFVGVKNFNKAPHPENFLDALENKLLVEKLFAELREPERHILELIFYCDYTQREVADIFDVTESAVSLRVEKILSKLRKISECLDQTTLCS